MAIYRGSFYFFWGLFFAFRAAKSPRAPVYFVPSWLVILSVNWPCILTGRDENVYLILYIYGAVFRHDAQTVQLDVCLGVLIRPPNHLVLLNMVAIWIQVSYYLSNLSFHMHLKFSTFIQSMSLGMLEFVQIFSFVLRFAIQLLYCWLWTSRLLIALYQLRIRRILTA